MSDECSNHVNVEPAAALSKALVELRQRYFSHFLSRLPSRADAEDAFQDFVVRALEAGAQMREPDRLEAWLGRVQRSTLVDRYRREGARREGQRMLELTPQACGCGDDVAHAQMLEAATACVRKAIPQLRETYATILRSVYFEGQALTDFSEAHGLSPTNAAVRLHRAREAVRRAIADACAACEQRPHCVLPTPSQASAP